MMAETVYFDAPDVQVTDVKIVTPWGVYRPQDVRSVQFERTDHFSPWLAVALLVIYLGSLFLYMTKQTVFDLPLDVFFAVGMFCNLLLLVSWLRAKFEVKMRGTFGLVTFDCDGDRNYAWRLTKALEKLIKVRESQLGNISGAHNG